MADGGPDLATGDGERLCYAGRLAEEEEGREAPTLCLPGGAPPARDSPRRELCSVADRTGRVAGAPFVFGSSASSPVSPALLLCASPLAGAGGESDAGRGAEVGGMGERERVGGSRWEGAGGEGKKKKRRG
jgi:hypothetical protein